jgi:hypothetical protein
MKKAKMPAAPAMQKRESVKYRVSVAKPERWGDGGNKLSSISRLKGWLADLWRGVFD